MKLLYITAISGTMDFFIDTIKDLQKKGYQVDLACSTERETLNSVYKTMGCTHFEIDCSRSISVKSVKKTIQQIHQIVKQGQYDIVHCHTPIAAFCTRIACNSFRKKGLKVIYTAHGFHFFKGSPLKNWLIYCPAELICSPMTDVLITINTEDYEFSKKMFSKKNVYIPGVGIDIARFQDGAIDTVVKKEELGLPKDARVMMTVGDLNENKNQQLVIRCMAELSEHQNLHYLLAGTGALREQLEDLAENLGIKDRVHFLGYRTDIRELYSICDFTVFPSLREGLSVSIMESMAVGLPVICADIRGNRDLIDNQKGGFLCTSNDKDSFLKAISSVLSDSEMCQRMGEYNLEKIPFFSKEKTIAEIEAVYQSV